MANTRKPRKSEPSARARASAAVTAAVTATLRAHVRAGDRVAVALSGGMDSMVLLDVLARVARRRRFTLAALHVNHQLSPHAARWAAFCRAQCRARGVPLKVVRVTVPRRDSVEAQARALRLAAFGRLDVDWVATAHHADDQAETVLYQLLRGAGTRGLAAMPVSRPLRTGGTGPRLLRPLLGLTRDELAACARARKLAWVEDESNADVRYDRNFLRQRVLPLIEERFPHARRTLARAAAHAAASEELNENLARADAGVAVRDGALPLAALKSLSPPRATNLLRWFIAERGLPQPPAVRLQEALRQLVSARRDAQVNVAWAGVTLRRHQGRAYLVHATIAPRTLRVRWNGERRLRLPALGGVLHMAPARGRGLARARLHGRKVEIRVRQGAERISPGAGRPRRTLKNLLQEAGVAPWARPGWPLIFVDGELAAVPGVCVSAAFQAGAGEPGIAADWQPG
jgi:tRNA(Ile)-lysidine synthase